MAEKIPLDKLASDLDVANHMLFGQRFVYLPDGTKYRITGFGYRRSDMKIEAHYTPLGEFYNRVIFHREISEFSNAEKFEFLPEVE